MSASRRLHFDSHLFGSPNLTKCKHYLIYDTFSFEGIEPFLTFLLLSHAWKNTEIKVLSNLLYHHPLMYTFLKLEINKKLNFKDISWLSV